MNKLLKTFFETHKKVAIAFSGGVDSAYLLYAAKAAGCDVRAYYVKSRFQPQFELEDARRLAGELNVPMTEAALDILQNPSVAANGADRCYHCKRAIFTLIMQLAAADGHTILCDGTNSDDDEGDRPGMAALRELRVLSPLREAGLSKREIRELSREAGLFTHDKASYACLATRIPTGTEITADLLEKTERAEDAMSALGFTDFRVRYRHGAAVIQVSESQLPAALERHEKIRAALSPYYDDILLDLRPR